jgi:hypothetical protein
MNLLSTRHSWQPANTIARKLFQHGLVCLRGLDIVNHPNLDCNHTRNTTRRTIKQASAVPTEVISHDIPGFDDFRVCLECSLKVLDARFRDDNVVTVQGAGYLAVVETVADKLASRLACLEAVS